MKKFFIIIASVLMLASLTFINAEPRRVLLEYCTGTWCGYCPCGHQAIDNQIIPAYPNTIFIAYHGGSTSNDPWKDFNGSSIRTLLGFSGYPTGIVDRTNTPSNPYYTYNLWMGGISSRYTSLPSAGVNILLTQKSFNAGTRQLTVSANLTAAQNLSGQYKISYVLIENNLVYPQTIYAACGNAGIINEYVHKHVARSMMNGAAGVNINTGGAWNQGQTFTSTANVTLELWWTEANCEVIAFVYKDSSNIALGGVEQAYIEPVTTPLGITEYNEVPAKYELGQNYPNPFNPSTHVKFSIPKAQSSASMKIFDVNGKLVMTIFEGPISAGQYNAEIDGALLSSGVYFYTLQTNEFTSTRKMLLVK